jgi:hypothetical protein
MPVVHTSVLEPMNLWSPTATTTFLTTTMRHYLLHRSSCGSTTTCPQPRLLSRQSSTRSHRSLQPPGPPSLSMDQQLKAAGLLRLRFPRPTTCSPNDQLRLQKPPNPKATPAPLRPPHALSWLLLSTVQILTPTLLPNQNRSRTLRQQSRGNHARLISTHCVGPHCPINRLHLNYPAVFQRLNRLPSPTKSLRRQSSGLSHALPAHLLLGRQASTLATPAWTDVNPSLAPTTHKPQPQTPMSWSAWKKSWPAVAIKTP